MIEVTVERLLPDGVSDAFVVVLREKNGQRILPIWIRRLEAESIAEALQHIQPKRPLTHDLCKSIIVSLGGTLEAVHITRMQSETYYANLLVAQSSGTVHIDARPSDSIAIAVRMNAPIYAQELLLSVVGVLGAAPSAADATLLTPAESELNAEQLKQYLQTLRPEDFGKFSP